MLQATSSDAGFPSSSCPSRLRAKEQRRSEGIKGRRQKVFAAPGEKFLAACISPLFAGTGDATTSPARKGWPEYREASEGKLQTAPRAGLKGPAGFCRDGESDGEAGSSR